MEQLACPLLAQDSISGRKPLRSACVAARTWIPTAMVIAMACCNATADAIPPRQLVEVVDIGAPVVSPGGMEVAYRVEQASIERNTYETVWFVQSLDGDSSPRRVADGGTPLRDSAGLPLPAPPVWSPDGRWIYYRAMLNGSIDVWRAAADGSKAEPLTVDPADVREFELSADGKVLRYRVGPTREEVRAAEQAEYDSGIRIDESVPLGQGLFRSGNTEGRLATQRYGDVWFDRVPLKSGSGDSWKSLDLEGARRQSLVPVSSGGRPSARASAEERDAWIVASDSSGQRIATLVRTGDGEGLRQKPDVRLSARTGAHAKGSVTCSAELCAGKAISGIQWRPDSEEVVFTVMDPDEGLAQSIFRWNVTAGWVRPIIRGQGQISGGRDRRSQCGTSSDVLVCVVAEAGRPPRLESIRIEDGARRVLYEPNSQLDAEMAKNTSVRPVRWADSAGRRFTGQFFPARRNGSQPPPLFITYYQCAGFLRGGVGDEWPLASMAERGVSALCINAPPYRLDAFERYDLALSGVSSAIEFLADAGEIDRARVGMGGLSFGTEATMWTVMNSSLLTAASITSPAISHQYHLLGSLKGKTFLDGLARYWQAGAPADTPERWRRLSPALNLERIRIPILMQMPEQEYMHSLDYSVPLILSGKADLYVFPNEPHQKFQPRHKLAAYERNLDWFLFWLLGIEDPAPAKVEQYGIWRSMRAREPSSIE